MPRFSAASEAQLGTAHPALQRLFREVVLVWDCKVLEGHRGQEAQDRAYREGRSQIRWPNGNHNAFPSQAVDVAPFPIDWKDTGRFYAFGGFVLGVAHGLDLRIRWGGDWDGDRLVRDQTFNDLVHFELLK